MENLSRNAFNKEKSFLSCFMAFLYGGKMYDIIIIGAGVIGSFVARSLSKYELKVGIIDKHIDGAMGASGANSGIIHAGYDAKKGTLKAKFNVAGSKMMEQVCKELAISYNKCGSLVIAFNDEELKVLDELLENGIAEGISDLSIINKEQVLTLEPNINSNVKGALLAKNAAMVSPYKLNLHALENAVINQVEFIRENEVVDIKKEKDIFYVKTDKSTIKSKMVINCAGVYADEIAKMVGDDSIKIIPRSGEYILFDKTEGDLVNKVIFQTPTSNGKGVLLTQTVDGNLLLGPDAKVLESKELHETHKESIDFIYKKGLKTCDKLPLNKTITTFTGIRATPIGRDFIIGESSKCSNFINVAGIESPGLSSAPAIGEYVEELVINILKNIKVKEKYTMTLHHRKAFSDMTEKEKTEAIKKNPLYGKIICRCENVTEGEIIDSIHSFAGAKTVDGVKKRTRAGMGRCQGGFCLPSVVNILARELQVEKEKINKNDDGSYILTRRTRV